MAQSSTFTSVIIENDRDNWQIEGFNQIYISMRFRRGGMGLLIAREAIPHLVVMLSKAVSEDNAVYTGV